MVHLYRAVSETEFEQLLRTQRFTPAPNTYDTGRFFALTLADALRWASALAQPRVVRALFADSVVREMMHWDRMDGIGSATFASWQQLAEVVRIEEVAHE